MLKRVVVTFHGTIQLKSLGPGVYIIFISFTIITNYLSTLENVVDLETKISRKFFKVKIK
jgi:hypothetical protein